MHRRRPGPRQWLLAAVLVLAGGAAALALARVAPAPTTANTPIFAGGEPVNPHLQAVYARAPLAPLSSDDGTWSQFGHDAAHSFATGGGHGALRGRVAWFAPLGGPALAAPALDRRLLYVSGSDGFLRALDPRTGKLRWRAGLGDSLGDASPALGGGRIYVDGYGTLTLAFDAATGRPLWQADNGHLPTAPPTYYRGLVLVPSDGNFLSCYDAASGKLYWRFQSEDAQADFWPTTGAAAAQGHTAYVALGASSEFMAIDLSSGLKQWEYALYERPAGAPVLWHGAVYVATTPGRIVALDAASGTPRWTATLPTGLGKGTRATPLLAGGRLYIGGDDGGLYAYSARTGRRLWVFHTGAPILSTPLLVGTSLYLPGGNGLLYCLDAASGRRRWTLRLGQMRAAPAYLDGTLFVASAGAGGLYAVR